MLKESSLFIKHVKRSCPFMTLRRKPINSFPGDKIQALFRLKAFADNNFSVAQMVQFFFDGLENIVGKGESAGNQHFLLFPIWFLKGFYPRGVKSYVVVKG